MTTATWLQLHAIAASVHAPRCALAWLRRRADSAFLRSPAWHQVRSAPAWAYEEQQTAVGGDA